MFDIAEPTNKIAVIGVGSTTRNTQPPGGCVFLRPCSIVLLITDPR
jgi:hypothetical protein